MQAAKVSNKTNNSNEANEKKNFHVTGRQKAPIEN